MGPSYKWLKNKKCFRRPFTQNEMKNYNIRTFKQKFVTLIGDILSRRKILEGNHQAEKCATPITCFRSLIRTENTTGFMML